MFDSKLNSILEDLLPLAQQGKIAQFLTSTKNMDKLSGMVDDIRDAMMDYQVCPRYACSHPS